MTNDKLILDRVIAFIGKRNMTMAELARGIGLANPNQVAKHWKNRERIPPQRYASIANLLGIKLDDLIGRKESLSQNQNLLQKFDISPVREAAETVGLPFVEWKNARGTYQVRDLNALAYPALARSASSSAFWTTAETDAVSNRIPRGALIVIDPEAPIEHGKYVLIEKQGDLLLRKLSRDGDRWLLVGDTSISQVEAEPYHSASDNIVGVVRQVFIEP